MGWLFFRFPSRILMRCLGANGCGEQVLGGCKKGKWGSRHRIQLFQKSDIGTSIRSQNLLARLMAIMRRSSFMVVTWAAPS